MVRSLTIALSAVVLLIRFKMDVMGTRIHSQASRAWNYDHASGLHVGSSSWRPHEACARVVERCEWAQIPRGVYDSNDLPLVAHGASQLHKYTQMLIQAASQYHVRILRLWRCHVC